MTLKELGDSSFSPGAIDMLPVPAASSTCTGTATEESILFTSCRETRKIEISFHAAIL